jgi:hypothetical protein
MARRGPESNEGRQPGENQNNPEKIPSLPYSRTYELPDGIIATINFSQPDKRKLPTLEYTVEPPFIPTPEQQRRINRFKSVTSRLIGCRVGIGEMKFAEMVEGSSSSAQRFLLGQDEGELHEQFLMRAGEALSNKVPMPRMRSSVIEASRTVPGRANEGAKMGERHEDVALQADELIRELEESFDEKGNLKPRENPA